MTSPKRETGRQAPKEIGPSDPRLSGLIDRVNLQSAMDGLPPGYRDDVQGYEHREIDRLLGHSIGNSKSQLHMARKRLRKPLQGTPGFRTRRNRETVGRSVEFAAGYWPSGKSARNNKQDATCEIA